MNIFITGVEGFVGKELSAQCGTRGIDVMGIDLVPRSRPNYYMADIRSQEIRDFIPEGSDALVHLAGLSRDDDCKGRAYECFDINVMGTLNLVEAAVKRGVKQFIFASSEWVYNEHTGSEVNEETPIDITKHTSAYALSKLVSEANLRQQFQYGSCAVTILRFGIIYGPRPKPWSAVESLMSTVRQQEEVTVGSLKSGRRFIHVSDIARGIIQACGLPGFHIINLTGNRVVTLKDIIETSQLILKKRVVVHEKNPDEVSIRNPANLAAKRLMGWEPATDLYRGMESLMPVV